MILQKEKTELVLSLHTYTLNASIRKRAWTPWSVFQDGSFRTSFVLLPENTGSLKCPKTTASRVHLCRCPWRTDQVTDIRAKSSINIQLRSLQINARSTRADGIAVSSVVPAVCGGFKQTDYSRSALQQVVHSTAPTGHCRIQRNRRYQVLVEQWSQARTTLFPKYFTSFPHGTCSLSDSRK